MPPLFVDGVEIRELFVDGEVQQSMFVDGVQVYTGVSLDFVERTLPQPAGLLNAGAVNPSGVFVGLGHTTPGDTIYAVSSPDGNVFTKRTVPFGNGDAHMVSQCAFATLGDLFYATGDNGSRVYCLTALGEDNWIERPTYPGTFGNSGGIAYDGTGLFVSTPGGEIFSSPTAESWTLRGNPGFLTKIDTYWANGWFVNTGIGVRIPAPGESALDVSSNGTSWTRRLLPQSNFAVSYAVAYSPQLDRWVCVGDTFANGNAYIVTAESTPDGTWTTRSNPIPQNTVLRSITWVPNLGFIVVGQELSGTPVIAVSIDGITWENVSTHPFFNVPDTEYVSVREVNGKVVIYGNNTAGNTGLAISN